MSHSLQHVSAAELLYSLLDVIPVQYLDRLPDVCLDGIMATLDRRSHLALSSTSRTLHAHANRHLYRHAPESSKQQALDFQQSLINANDNIKYLRTHITHSIGALGFILANSPTPLTLDSVRVEEIILSDPGLSQAITDWLEMLLSIRPGSSVKHVKFGPNCMRLAAHPTVLGSLSAIPNLERLTMFICDTPKIQQILDTINCPNLAYIELHYNIDDESNERLTWAIPLRKNLPNLKLLYYNTCAEGLDLETENTWRCFEAMMKRDVFLRLTGELWMDIVYSPWRTVLKFASTAELNGAMQWILDGEDYYQRDILGRCQYELDIRDLSTTDRDRVLEFLRHHPKPLNTLKICVDKSDCLAPRRMISQDYIPKNTSHIDLYMLHRIDPDFVPALLALTLGRCIRIRSLSVNVYGSSELVLGRRVIAPSISRCTAATFVIPPKDYFREQAGYQFLLSPGKPTRFKHTEFIDWDKGSFELLPETIQKGMKDVLDEVNGWFRYSPLLREVQFNLWYGPYGTPEKFCFTENERFRMLLGGSGNENSDWNSSDGDSSDGDSSDEE